MHQIGAISKESNYFMSIYQRIASNLSNFPFKHHNLALNNVYTFVFVSIIIVAIQGILVMYNRIDIISHLYCNDNMMDTDKHCLLFGMFLHTSPYYDTEWWQILYQIS